MKLSTALVRSDSPFTDLEHLAKKYGMTKIVIMHHNIIDDEFEFTCEFPGKVYKRVVFKSDVEDIVVLETLFEMSKTVYSAMKTPDIGINPLLGSRTFTSKRIMPTLVDNTLNSVSFSDMCRKLTKEELEHVTLEVLKAFLDPTESYWKFYTSSEDNKFIIESERGIFRLDNQRFVDVLISLGVLKAVE